MEHPKDDDTARTKLINIWDALREHCIDTQNVGGTSLDDIFHRAIDTSDIPMIACFLDNGYAIAGEGKHFTPPLAHAVAKLNLSIVGYLMSRGASIGHRDWRNATIVELATAEWKGDKDKTRITDDRIHRVLEEIHANTDPDWIDPTAYGKCMSTLRVMNCQKSANFLSSMIGTISLS